MEKKKQGRERRRKAYWIVVGVLAVLVVGAVAVLTLVVPRCSAAAASGAVDGDGKSLPSSGTIMVYSCVDASTLCERRYDWVTEEGWVLHHERCGNGAHGKCSESQAAHACWGELVGSRLEGDRCWTLKGETDPVGHPLEFASR